jgi:hypothetical protein
MEILYLISTQNYGGKGGTGADDCTTTSVFLIHIIPSMLHTHLVLMTY